MRQSTQKFIKEYQEAGHNKRMALLEVRRGENLRERIADWGSDSNKQFYWWQNYWARKRQHIK